MKKSLGSSLTKTLYTQLGITESIMDGTADEATMLNYFERTIDPILSAIIEKEGFVKLGIKICCFPLVAGAF